jgi:putative endonuclease
MEKQYYVYIMTNKYNTVTYTGVTNDLLRRITEHKEKANEGFTSRYRINKLVYYEVADEIDAAIGREKQIKTLSRQNKVSLINKMNPKWEDLCEGLLS